MNEEPNPGIRAMMAKYNATNPEMLCQQGETPMACDARLGNAIVYEESKDLAFAGPDGYMFERISGIKDRASSCKLTYFKLEVAEQPLAYGIRKDAPYKRAVNTAIVRCTQHPAAALLNCQFFNQCFFPSSRLKESGLLQKMVRDYVPSKPDCESIAKTGYKPVDLRFTINANIILLVGYALAIAFCLFEVVAARMKGNATSHVRN